MLLTAGPVVTVGTAVPTFIVGNPPVSVAPTLNITETNSGVTSLTGATVTISNPQDGASEVLEVSTAGTAISASYNNSILTLSGTDTIANYQKVSRYARLCGYSK